jgi:hypothetical protein
VERNRQPYGQETGIEDEREDDLPTPQVSTVRLYREPWTAERSAQATTNFDKQYISDQVNPSESLSTPDSASALRNLQTIAMMRVE